MSGLLGTSFSVFFGMTVVLMGFVAFVTGQALANTWRPRPQACLYPLLLGLFDRFLTFALFEGELLSLTGFLIDSAVLVAISLFAYAYTRARKMETQYPWLYERVGLFGWRERSAAD